MSSTTLQPSAVQPMRTVEALSLSVTLATL